MPGLSAVVSVQAGFGGEITALAVAGVPVVAIDVQDLQPAERLSTLGEPGARHDQAGFLAGMMAGLATRSGWVGLIDGNGGSWEAAVYRNAFVNGLRYACAACTLVTLSPGEVTADAFRAKGADVVFALPGPEAGEGLASLADTGMWLVHVGDLDVPILTPQVAGRVVFEPEQALVRALEALLAGEPGASWPASLELGSLRLADLNPEAISPGRERLLSEAIEALLANELDIGIDLSTGGARP